MSYLFEGLAPFLLIILFIVVFVKLSNLKFRLMVLENKLSPQPKEAVPTADLASAPAPVSAESFAPAVTSENKFVTWLKDDWLLKLGGFLLLIGLGWFATYAFMNNWIGPAGRITLGIAAGILILIIGTFRIRKYINQGGIFLVLGSATILLTVFAACEVYDMFNYTMALGIMFLSSAYVALVSVKYKSFAVALSGLVLSVAAPLLAGGSDDRIVLFAYLMVVVLGVIWIVAIRKNWGAMVFASLISVFLYSLPVLLDGYKNNESASLLNFSYAFTLVFFISSLISIIKSHESDIKAFLWTAILNGLFVLVWVMTFADKDWQSLIISIWMVIFAAGAFILFAGTKIRNVFYVYAVVAVAMLATATAVELEGAALTIAYTIESALIPILIYFTTKDLKASATSSFLLIGPIILSLGNLERYYRSNLVISEDFFVLALLSIALICLGLMFKRVKKSLQVLDLNIDNVWLIVGSVYLYTLIWTTLHIAMREDYAVATTIALIIFTVVGLVKYFYGISIGSRILRNYGGIFLGLVVLRLIFIDVWDMEMSVRIVVFVLVGLLLISTAFISKKIKNVQIN